jgi:hypothetical protein
MDISKIQERFQKKVIDEYTEKRIFPDKWSLPEGLTGRPLLC